MRVTRATIPSFISPFTQQPNLQMCLGMTVGKGGALLGTEDFSGANEWTINGNPEFFGNDYGVSWLTLDGIDDYLSAPDSTLNKLTGGIFSILALVRRRAAQPGAIFSKLGASGNTSWSLYYSGTDRVVGKVTATGADVDSIQHYATVGATIETWQLYSFRYVPSTKIRVGLNGSFAENVTSIPASVFNSTSPVNIGRHPNGTQFLAADVAVVTAAQGYVSDGYIQRLVSHCRRCGV